MKTRTLATAKARTAGVIRAEHQTAVEFSRGLVEERAEADSLLDRLAAKYAADGSTAEFVVAHSKATALADLAERLQRVVARLDAEATAAEAHEADAPHRAAEAERWERNERLRADPRNATELVKAHLQKRYGGQLGVMLPPEPITRHHLDAGLDRCVRLGDGVSEPRFVVTDEGAFARVLREIGDTFRDGYSINALAARNANPRRAGLQMVDGAVVGGGYEVANVGFDRN